MRITKKISLEGKILLAISFFDCANTTLSTQFGLAKELNPMMNFLLTQGVWVFIIGKITISLALISALEILRYTQPHKVKFIESCQQVGIIGYLALIILVPLIYHY